MSTERTAPIKPREVVRTFDKFRNLKLTEDQEAGTTGAFARREKRAWKEVRRKLEHKHIARKDEIQALRTFFNGELSLEGTLEDQMEAFRDLLPPGAQLTPERRINAVANKLLAVGREIRWGWAEGTEPTANGRVSLPLVDRFERELGEGTRGEGCVNARQAARIQFGLIENGIALDPNEDTDLQAKIEAALDGGPEADTFELWWKPALQNYRDFGAEWHGRREA